MYVFALNRRQASMGKRAVVIFCSFQRDRHALLTHLMSAAHMDWASVSHGLWLASIYWLQPCFSPRRSVKRAIVVFSADDLLG